MNQIYSVLRPLLSGSILLVLAFLLVQTVQAHSQSNAEHDVLMLVRTDSHLGAALETAGDLQEGKSFKTGRIEIIVCGEASRALLKGSPQEEAIRKASTKGVTVTACGMSLGQMKIDPQQLIGGVKVVPNGLMRALELQADGYLSVEL